jgi:copper(I)-binding protein
MKMKINWKAPSLMIVLALLGAFAIAGCGENDEKATTTTTTDVTITNPWARVTTPGQDMGAAYMTITGPEGDKLIKAEVDPSIADHAELHKAVMATDGGSKDEMSSSGGDMHSSNSKKMTMVEVPSIPVPAMLKPGGYHVMLIGLKKPIAAGDTVKLTLTFDQAGEKQVTATAKD